jgi:hypothetical protein
MTNYQVIDTHTGYIVKTYATLIRACRAADELDSAYGAVRYTVRRIDTRASGELHPALHCPACEQQKPDQGATSRYTHKPICSECATREAFDGPFWIDAAQAWAETQARHVGTP